MVDWKGGASTSDYIKAANNTRIVAKGISDFITNNKLNLSLVYCVGHSLGGQVLFYHSFLYSYVLIYYLFN